MWIAGKASALAGEFGLEECHGDYGSSWDDPEIDVIDICTPPFLHPGMTLEALAAGKHVICEKPLTVISALPATGRHRGQGPQIRLCTKRFSRISGRLKRPRRKRQALHVRRELCLFAEYPEGRRNNQGPEEQDPLHEGRGKPKGSTSPVAGRWDRTGGGSLIRVGCHPIGGILWLKREEAGRGKRPSAFSASCATRPA